jgi:hypothetical protein
MNLRHNFRSGVDTVSRDVGPAPTIAAGVNGAAEARRPTGPASNSNNSYSMKGSHQ